MRFAITSRARDLGSLPIVALALLASACVADAPEPLTAPARLGAPSAARVEEVITTPIIPANFSPNPSSAPWGHATAINEQGVVAGWTGTPTDAYAFIWKDNVMTNLGTLFYPVAINRAGEIAGNAPAGAGAVLWKGGTLTTLTTLGDLSVAYDLNDKGQVVGYSRTVPGSANHAVIWENGTITDLGTLGGSSSIAASINKHGQVVGYSQTAGNAATHAFLWERGEMTDLGTLYGGTSEAFAINDKGEIVGLTTRPASSRIPFIWRKGVMAPLWPGVISAAAFFVVSDISNAGHVVGARACCAGDLQAFVTRDGVDIDLPGRPSSALSVNSRGEIAGDVLPGLGTPGAYLWTVGRHAP